MIVHGITCLVLLFCSCANTQDISRCYADSCVNEAQAAFEDQHDKTQMLQSGLSVHHNLADDDGNDKFQASARAEPEPEPEPGAEPEPEPEPETEDAINSQFLITATFGPTKKTMAEKKNLTYAAWVNKQIHLPLSSHREYYRLRTNPDLPSSSFPFRGVCAKGSRWSETVFSLHDAETRAVVTIANGSILVNGLKRSAVNPAPVQQCDDVAPPGGRFLGGKSCKVHGLGSRPWNYCRRWDWKQNKWCRQTCFDKMQSISWHRMEYDCSGGWASKPNFRSQLCPQSFSKNTGALLRFSTDGRCGASRRRAVPVTQMPQIKVWENVSSPALNASLFETVKHVGSALFLKGDQMNTPSVCNVLKSGSIKVGSRSVVLDNRVVLAENTLANPIQGRVDACTPRTFVNKKACMIGNTASACPLTCGSPGEGANDPTQGHLFPIYTAVYTHRRRRGVPQQGAYMVDTRRTVPEKLTKSMVWTEIILDADDQLRQRVAWALSQIIVVGISGFPDAEKETECWTYFYDIMVRNAFGNFENILREVTYSPVMATYLTYLNSESFDSKGSAPDENYAREIMQLFTIGLEKLAQNGTKLRDHKNLPIPTYTSQHIVNFAKVFTGFTERGNRANIEVSTGNRVDPMVLDSTFHDKYPKPDLYGGYIGDRYPLCVDLPKDAFLQQGATYEYVGNTTYFYSTPRGTFLSIGHCRSGYIGGGRSEAASLATCLAKCKSQANCRFVSFWLNRWCARYDSRAGSCATHLNRNYRSYKLERGPEGTVFTPQAGSALAAALTSAPQVSVTLSQKIPCTGIECRLDTMDMVAVGDYLYAFVKPKCVYNFFMPVQKEINCTTTQVLDPDSQAFCCAPGSTPTPVPGIKEEQFYFNPGGRIPSLSGRTPSKTRQVLKVEYQNTGGTWPGWNSRDNFIGRWTGSLVITSAGAYTFSLYSDDGSRLFFGSDKVVDNDGLHGWRKRSGNRQLAAGAHALMVEAFERGGHAGVDFRYKGPDTNNQETDVIALQASPATCPRPVTADVILLPGSVEVTSNVAGNGFPVNWDGAVPNATTPVHVTAEILEVKVFNQVPTVADLRLQLLTGAFAPTIACTHSCSGPVKGYAVDGTTIDEKTVFEFNGVYFKNSKSIVRDQVGSQSFSFRNPPVFLHPHSGVSKHEQDEAADAEVLGVINHLLYHQNTPFTLARKMIQRLTKSNPPLPYLQSVAEAFRTGTFNGTNYSGQYGDMAAMVAAIFLHPEARTNNKRASGALREPMLKIMHFMRSMEHTDKLAEPVVFKELVAVTGQFPYYSPTVFNYYDADYMPMNFGMPGNMPSPHTPEPEPEPEPEPLVAPEFQILIPPLLLNWMNGMKSMTKHGVSPCDAGFGENANNGCWQGHLNADTTIGDLNVLLTGGRLTKHHAGTLRAAWKNAQHRNEWPEQAARQAMLFMPEFHTLGDPLSNGTRGPEPTPTATNPVAYKALVMLFLAGGADTFNMLVPRDCPLHQSYATARNGCNIPMNQLHAIQADTQDCKKFGIHPSMPRLKNLYVAKEAAFISNIGALTAPSTRFNLVGRCPNQGSHSHGQMAAQTLNCMGVGLFTGNGGVAGKLADELAATNKYKASSFSISGKPAWSESIRTKVQILDGRNGVIRFEGYSDWKGIIDSVTKEKLNNVFAEEFTISFKDAVNSSESFSQFLNDPKYNPPNYGTPSGLSRQLRQVAKLIATRVTRKAERDFFWTNIGGWDMHSGINMNLPRNLGAVDEAINTFVTEMKRQQVFDNIALITASDFARTLTYNGAGTDHAWAANHVIVGGAVNGGVVYNEFLKDYVVGPTNDQVMDTRGRVVPKFPWENMMVPIAKWLGVNETSLNKIFPNLPNFNRSAHILSENVLFKGGSGGGSSPAPGGSGGGSGSGGSGSR